MKGRDSVFARDVNPCMWCLNEWINSLKWTLNHSFFLLFPQDHSRLQRKKELRLHAAGSRARLHWLCYPRYLMDACVCVWCERETYLWTLLCVGWWGRSYDCFFCGWVCVRGASRWGLKVTEEALYACVHVTVSVPGSGFITMSHQSVWRGITLATYSETFF